MKLHNSNGDRKNRQNATSPKIREQNFGGANFQGEEGGWGSERFVQNQSNNG